MLVKAAQGVESGVKKFNKFDDKVTKAVTKKVGKAAKKVGMAALRGTAGAVGGAVKGAFQGAGKGIKKGMREELLASGVFSEHEVTKLIWNEFDTDIEENYRAMRNPEKYERNRIRNLKETNLIIRDLEQQEWQIQIEESTHLHLKSSWLTEGCLYSKINML